MERESTLLLALAGLLPLANGRIEFAGKIVGKDLSLLEYHRRTAAVFQDALLLRGTVRHNVSLGLRLRVMAASDQQDRIEHWLEHLKISHLADRSIGTLSGGEAQRTSLARALVLDPECLLLDELFAALDAPTRHALVADLADILTERRIAALFVTHDLGEAVELCDRCVVLDQGRVLQEDGLSNIIQRPQSRRVAEITGAENIFEAFVAETTAEGVWLKFGGKRIKAAAAGASLGIKVTFVVRPEALQLSRDPPDCGDNALSGPCGKIARDAAGAARHCAPRKSEFAFGSFVARPKLEARR
jgi:tungstate transport system ATP-binding protein